jgi:hypothetical protein
MEPVSRPLAASFLPVSWLVMHNGVRGGRALGPSITVP